MSDNYSWKELESRFNELSPQMTGARMDVQWGSVPKRFSIVGCGNMNALDKYYAISSIAGKKLLDSMKKSDIENNDELKNENNPIMFWLKALKEFSGRFEPEYLGQQNDMITGESLGAIYIGRIYNITDVSAIQCINYSFSYPEKQTADIDKTKVENIIKQSFWDKYLVPIIVSVIASLIAGIILFFL